MSRTVTAGTGGSRRGADIVVGTGFKRAEVVDLKRLVLSVEAEQKRGKTHFALTAPRPLGFINLDDGLEGVINKHDLKGVYISDLAPRWRKVAKLSAKSGTTAPQQVASAAGEVWSQFYKDFMAGLERMRTIVVDSGSEMHELIRLARFGKLTQVMPEHYGPVNAEMSQLLRSVYDTDCNLLLLHRLQAEYVEQPPTSSGKRQPAKPSGRMIRAGFKGVPYIVQGIIRLDKDESGFNCTIEECRHRPEVEGTELPQDMVRFSEVAQLIFEDTSDADWK